MIKREKREEYVRERLKDLASAIREKEINGNDKHEWKRYDKSATAKEN